MAPAFAAPFGLIIGSFLNVVAYRLPRGESLVRPGSHCPACGAELRPYDNVPLLSWLVLRGRCRRCRVRISARYPLVELATGAVFAAVVLARGVRPELVLDLPFAAMLIAVASVDLEHHRIPNRIVYPLAVYAIAGAAAVRPHALPSLLIAGAGAFAFFLAAAVAYPRGMGMGDVKLAGAMGLFLGLSVVPALFIAFLSGSVAGLALRRRGLPFGVFLALGGIVGLVAGPALIHLYTHTLLHR